MTESEKESLKQRGKLTKYYYRNGQKKDDHEKLLAKAVAHRCSANKVLLQISQNSQENTCASVADLRSATLFKKKLWHSCFPVNFMKFLKTLFS